MQVRLRVHYNLHKKCLSVLDKKTRRVIGYAPGIILRNVRFVVSAKGIARIRKDGRKHVVAFIEGDLASLDAPTINNVTPNHRQCYFDPYRWGTFVDISRQSLIGADECVVIDKQMFMLNPQYGR